VTLVGFHLKLYPNLLGMKGFFLLPYPLVTYHLVDVFQSCNCVGDMFTEEQNELVESAAEMLYGLIHARYILTSKGLAAMVHILL
jgi:hypothetical protein